MDEDSSLYIDKYIRYYLKTQTFNKQLEAINLSPFIYVFKIKTNQKDVISLQKTCGFILPNQTLKISMRLLQKPHEKPSLKLEFHYAIASDQLFSSKDSSMKTYPKENISKQLIVFEQGEDFIKESPLASKRFTMKIKQNEAFYHNRSKFQQDQAVIRAQLQQQRARNRKTALQREKQKNNNYILFLIKYLPLMIFGLVIFWLTAFSNQSNTQL